MLQDETELQHSYSTIAKLYSLRDRMAAEKLWTPSGRADAVAGVENMIRKIEAEIAEYLARRSKKVA